MAFEFTPGARRLPARALVALALLVPALAPARAAGAQSVAARRTRAEAALDSVAAATVKAGRAAGFVVVAMRGADTLAARAYGHADVENAAPLGVDHVFQFASITKQFTAAAVLALVDSGLVALDTPVVRYLPSALPAGSPITVRQLLSHTAGLGDYAAPSRLSAMKALEVPPDTVLAVARDMAPYFAPGEQMRYSNTGFLLAGLLIERLTGRPYARWIEERVLAPAGLSDRTRFCDHGRIVPRLARGYAMGPAGLRPATFISPSLPWAAGGFCGTAGDLARWNLAVHGARGGRVISPAAHAEMTRPATVRSGRHTRYGLGLTLADVAGRAAWQHAGDIDGFTTLTAWLPDDSTSVTVLVNTQGPVRPQEIAAAVVRAALGAARPEPAVAAGDLARFAGTYGGEVTVTVATDARGQRVLRLSGGPMGQVDLRAVARGADGATFTDGVGRFTFEPGGSRSPGLWADMGVALVYWKRSP